MKLNRTTYALIIWLCISFMVPPHIAGAIQEPAEVKESVSTSGQPEVSRPLTVAEKPEPIEEPEITEMEEESQTIVVADDSPYGLDGKRIFNPDPTRAVWLSALFPGLGQIYNRRYWKLPLVIGAYLGLGYGCSWNNSMLNDYTRAYRDIMDSDPTTKSYMDFFPPTTKEEDLDKTWLTNVLKSRKDFYRRNRDLCIIAMVGMYFVAMVDAYVDASLSHFDITPDLSIDVSPAVMKDSRMSRPALGLSWALNF